MLKKINTTWLCTLIILVISSLTSCDRENDESSGGARTDDKLIIASRMLAICANIKKDTKLDLSQYPFYEHSFCSEVPSTNVSKLNTVANSTKTLGSNTTSVANDSSLINESRVDLYADSNFFEKTRNSYLLIINSLEKVGNASAKFLITPVEKLTFNTNRTVVTAKFELTSTEAQNSYMYIQNKWNLYGKKIDDNKYLISLDTYEVGEESAMQEAHLMIAIVTYSKGIYINTITKGNFINGMIDQVIKGIISEILVGFLVDLNQKYNPTPSEN